MITVAEIKKKAEKVYSEVLKSYLSGEDLFPLIIRSDKSLSKDFAKMNQEIAQVMASSKHRKGYGYTVVTETIKTRLHGTQDIPRSIQFDTASEYFQFVGKTNEFELFKIDVDYILRQIPQLKDWLLRYPLKVVACPDSWQGLIQVCCWFLNHFEPDTYYVRELPIAVHTKFIEEHQNILRSLLDELIPDKLNPQETRFEKRFYLLYDQPLIRFRLLDPGLKEHFPYTDMCVPQDQFSLQEIHCQKVFVVENLMTFLTFPLVTASIAIWGKGFAVESLKQAYWLNNKEIYYWSDLDVQGFQMLSQLRGYYPQTSSLLMSLDIFKAYEKFVTDGTRSPVLDLQHLSEHEREVYSYLQQNNLRLEQERTPQAEVINSIRHLVDINVS
jgi:hypothetical protein